MDSYIEKENIFCIFLKFDALKQYTVKKNFFKSSKNILLRFTLLTFFIENEKKKLQKGIHQDNFYSYFAPKNKTIFRFFLKKKTTAILNTEEVGYFKNLFY